MPGLCVIGLQWGDEAKGKLVDLLTEGQPSRKVVSKMITRLSFALAIVLFPDQTGLARYILILSGRSAGRLARLFPLSCGTVINFSCVIWSVVFRSGASKS